MDAIENIEFLARSKHRVRILDLLCEHGSLEKHALGSHLDASRTTVGRNLSALEERGWIRRTNCHCEITPQGELVAEKFHDLVDTVELADKLESFMRWVPDGSLDLDLRLLRDAEVLLPESGNPYAMVDRHVRILKESDHSRVVLPLCGLHAFEAVHQRVVNEGGRVESVVAPNVAETFRFTPEYAELTEELAPTSRFDVFVCEDDIPYFVGLFDGTVQIGVDEDGEPRAILETDAEEVVDWAMGVYEGYKRHSEPVQVVH